MRMQTANKPCNFQNLLSATPAGRFVASQQDPLKMQKAYKIRNTYHVNGA